MDTQEQYCVSLRKNITVGNVEKSWKNHKRITPEVTVDLDKSHRMKQLNRKKEHEIIELVSSHVTLYKLFNLKKVLKN